MCHNLFLYYIYKANRFHIAMHLFSNRTQMASKCGKHRREGGGGVLPYKSLMGTCGQPGYVFCDFVLNWVSNLSFFVLIRVSIYNFLS